MKIMHFTDSGGWPPHHLLKVLGFLLYKVTKIDIPAWILLADRKPELLENSLNFIEFRNFPGEHKNSCEN